MSKKDSKKLPFLVKLKTEEATPQKEKVPIIQAQFEQFQSLRKIKNNYGQFSNRKKILLALEQCLAGTWNE